MKILLIGYGNMGKNHYRAIEKLLQNTEHTLKVCDTNTENKTDYINYKIAINNINKSSTPYRLEEYNSEFIQNS